MNYKRFLRLISGVVAAVVLLASFSVVFADQGFPLSDVNTSDWYYDDVRVMFNKNIIGGYPDGTFLPQNYATKAEALKLVMGAAGYDMQNIPETGPWYALFAETAKNDGIIFDEFIDTIGESITRYETADIIVRALKLKYTSDMDSLDPFSDTDDKNATILNSMGIFLGEPADDGTKLFSGDRGLKRCELSAVILRTMRHIQASKNLSRETFVEPKTEFGDVFSDSDVMSVYSALINDDDGEITITSKGKNAWNNVKDNMSKITGKLGYITSVYSGITKGYNSIKLNATGYAESLSMQVVFENTSGKDVISRNAEVLKKAEEIYAQIWEELPNDADEKATAKAILEYIVLNCRYDTEARDSGNSAGSSDAYACLVEGKAVCSGYTSAFNLLLKIAGITCVGSPGIAYNGTSLNGEEHVWTLAHLDGEWYYMDATWCDPIPDREGRVSYEYLMTPADSLWDSHIAEYTFDELTIYIK